MLSGRTVAVLIALGVGILCCASPLRAAALPKGTVELAPTLSFDYDKLSFNGRDDGSVTTLNGSLLLGYFVSDLIEIEGGPVVNHQSVSPSGSSSSSVTSFGARGGLRLNFPTAGSVIPFLAAGVGFTSHSGDSPGTESSFLAPIVEIGTRIMVGQSAAVTIGAAYAHITNAFGFKDESSNSLALQVGVSAFPRIGQ